MKFGVPWSVKGIRAQARETAKEAARRSGLSLDEWLNSVVIRQAAEQGVTPEALAEERAQNQRAQDQRTQDLRADDLRAVNERLDDITRRIDKVARSSPAAYAPARSRGETDQIAELISRLDRRLDQFAAGPRAPRPQMPPPLAQTAAPPLAPAIPMPPSLERALAEISARQRALNGQQSLAPQPVAAPSVSAQPLSAQPMAEPAPVRQVPVAAPAAPPHAALPAQDLSGLEQQLRTITTQIETLRKPGVEEAINALRAELGDIGRALTDAMPRRAIDTIEKQIAGLTERIAEGRQAGVDASALSGIEHGLAEVRDALRSLTPAENLIGFNDAVAGLAHKIDLIVAQRDPATLQQLENAITTLREMAAHVASNDAIGQLAGEVQLLAEKVEHIAHTGAGSDALSGLEHRISALSEALAERAQNGATVPPRLEALVGSLSDKIEQLQHSRGDSLAMGHLEDRIVSLVEKLDASDSRLGHLEAIERGLADLLVHIEDMRATKNVAGLRAEAAPEVDTLKHDIARTQDALEAVNGTLGHVVDRLAMIEQGMRADARPQPSAPVRVAPTPVVASHAAPADEEPLELTQPYVGKLGVRLVSDAAAAAPAAIPSPPPSPPQAAPRRLPPVARLPINPELAADQPLEPGSGPPRLHANSAARIGDSEAALGGSHPQTASIVGKSSFIAAARRAAQAAVHQPTTRPSPADHITPQNSAGSTVRDRLMRRVKSLFVAACVIAIVIGAAQIASNRIDFGNTASKTAQSEAGKSETGKSADRIGDNSAEMDSDSAASMPSLNAASDAPATVAANPAPAMPNVLPGPLPLEPPAAAKPPAPLAPPETTDGLPPVLSAPGAQLPGITGSIPRRPAKPPAAAPVPFTFSTAHGGDGKLPGEIGGVRLRSAASVGDAAAAYEIGVRYAEGRGVPADLAEAARWFERAAGKGLAPAQFRYGTLLEKGQGVKKDLGEARRFYLAAAAKGNAKAMHNLAVLYAEGIDGRPDYDAAAEWFRKAADRGVSDSQFNLGVLYARGLGVETNAADSYKWFALAAAKGDKDAAKKRDEMAARLDPQALAAAEQAVKSFVAAPQPADAINVPAPPGGWDSAGSETAPGRAKPRISAPMVIGKR
jgi:localization factor PodJL